MTKKFLGETWRTQDTITDNTGALVDPSAFEIKTYDPAGTLKATSTAPTKDSQGVYHLDYDIPSGGTAGMWRQVWKITKDSKIDIEEFFVEVYTP